MDIIKNLLIILTPLFLGYAVTINTRYLNALAKLQTYLLYLLLFLMGFGLSQIEDLAKQFPLVATDVIVFVSVLHLFNFLVFIPYDKAAHAKGHGTARASSLDLGVLRDVCFLVGSILVGLSVGLFIQLFDLSVDRYIIDECSLWVLITLVFLVGLHMRNSSVSLQKVLLDKVGLTMAIYFSISCLVAGVLIGIFYREDLGLIKSLALSSGMGWYSLSSVIVYKAWGPIYGSTAFFIDLIRELSALFFVPILARKFPNTAVIQPGATSLDCSLPIIQKCVGTEFIPLAISFGFWVNVFVPILLSIFTSF